MAKSLPDLSNCTCPPVGWDPACPFVRGLDIGHVKACPAGRGPCPCLPGSLAHAHCSVETDEEEA
jgi:hypothetical protein